MLLFLSPKVHGLPSSAQATTGQPQKVALHWKMFLQPRTAWTGECTCWPSDHQAHARAVARRKRRTDLCPYDPRSNPETRKRLAEARQVLGDGTGTARTRGSWWPCELCFFPSYSVVSPDAWQPRTAPPRSYLRPRS